MLSLNVKYVMLFCLMGLFFSACVSGVDFDQGEDFTISPIIDASLIYFEEPASTFVDENGLEQTIVRDSVVIDAFSDQFIIDNLIKAEFLFEVTNSINRAYQAQVDFLDENDDLKHTFTFSVGASPTNAPVVAEHLEVFENASLEALKQSIKLVITLTMLPSTDGSVLDQNSSGDIKFRSKATFYLNIDTSS